MFLFSRNLLLRSSTVLSLTLAMPSCFAAETADHTWSGDTVLTMNDAAMRAEAVAEKEGRIIGVGTEGEVMKLRGTDTKVIDLAGRAMLPGFIDAHGHMFMGGFQALSANLLAPPDGEVTDIASLQQTLRDWAEVNREVVEAINLISGFGYDNAQLKEQRHPTREDPDAVSMDVPVLIIHQSGHLAALNSKALEIVGYDASTGDPAGGVIRREQGSQEPNGVLEELAMFAALGPLTNNIGPEGGKRMIAAGSEMWARFGYTTAQEGRSVPSQAESIRAAGKRGDLEIDIAAYVDVLVGRC